MYTVDEIEIILIVEYIEECLINLKKGFFLTIFIR